MYPVFSDSLETDYFNRIYGLCVSVCEYVHMSASAHGSQKRERESLELKLCAVVSHQIAKLGPKPGTSAGAAQLSNAESSFQHPLMSF